MKNDSQTKIAIVAAVLVGLFAVIAVNKYIKSQTNAAPDPTATILVCNEEVPDGSVLGAEMLATRQIPLSALSNIHISLPAANDPGYARAYADVTSKIVGRKVKRLIAANSPIFWIDVQTEEKPPFADLIADGNRAVTMTVDTASSVNGFIRPGSRVDVVLTATQSQLGLVTGDQGKGGNQVVSSVILQNAPVVAVGRNYDITSAEGSYSTLTFNLPIKAAVMMIQARTMGQLTYLLRNVRDTQTDSDRNHLTVMPGTSFGDAVRSF